MKQVEWCGSKKCDFCEKEIHGILIDGVTKHNGCWATMCEPCHKKHGYPKFGMGIGQKYKENKEGKFLKIEG